MSYENDLAVVKARYDAKVRSGELQGTWEPTPFYWLRRAWIRWRGR